MKAEVPAPLHQTGSGWGGSVGGDGDFTALRGRLMKSCCCSPLGAQLGEAAGPYAPSPSRPPSAERLVGKLAVPGASSPTAGQAKPSAETLPLPRAGSSFAKQRCQKDALQREEISLK